MDLEFNLFGEQQVVALMDALPHRMQRNVIRTAVRGGASVLRKAARANLVGDGTVRTGMLWRSINIKVKNYSRSGVIWAGVGSDRKVIGTLPGGTRLVPANYAHLVEHGTRTTAARPFLRPAFDSKRAAILRGMQTKARQGLAREIKKLRKATR